MECGVAQVRDEKIPLVEANGLLSKYIAIVEAISEEDVSGGVDVGVSVPSHTQARKGKDAKTPPESMPVKDEVDVLIVEQSDSLRKTLDTLLSRAGFATRAVDGPEAALSFLEKGRAAVVICDFRVPSMAAKAVVDFLRRRGNSVPVFVTTSQQGGNAETLVERLGVAGYISKPLDADGLVARVASHVRRPVGRSSGRP
jgi:CheY-like chemotaxis protein